MSALTLALFGGCAARPPPGAVAWRTDIAGRAEAAAEDRPLAIDFWAAWCPPCAAFDRALASDASMREVLSTRYVPIRVDLTVESARASGLARAYGVSALPAMVLVGREVVRLDPGLVADRRSLACVLAAFPTEGAGAVDACATPDPAARR